MAMPARKFTAMGRLYLGRGVSANPSIVVLSERLGYLSLGDDGLPAIGAVPVTGVLNFNFTWEGPNDSSWLTGISVTAGANNILNVQQPWVQAYDAGHAPMPGRGTDLFIRLSYALDVARPAP